MTNIRYADDILLFGKSLDEVVEMMDSLIDCLFKVGLEYNAKKTKLLSTSPYVDEEGNLIKSIQTQSRDIDILSGTDTHKYFGRKFPGNLLKRVETAVDYRMQCAWAKFRDLQTSFFNRHINQ